MPDCKGSTKRSLRSNLIHSGQILKEAEAIPSLETKTQEIFNKAKDKEQFFSALEKGGAWLS